MKSVWLTAALLALLAGVLFAQPGAVQPGIRFQAVDIFVDPQNQPLAAFQLEFSAKGSGAKVVGVEGGQHEAFKDAPYYDPRAIQQERVVIAAFNTAPPGGLPKQKTRIATIHLQTDGRRRPRYAIDRILGATSDGKEIAVTVTLEERMPK